MYHQHVTVPNCYGHRCKLTALPVAKSSSGLYLTLQL